MTRVEDGPEEPPRTVLRVVRGEPTPEELAAVLAVVTARSTAGPGRPSPTRRGWNALDRVVRRPLTPGPGRWTASGLPR